MGGARKRSGGICKGQLLTQQADFFGLPVDGKELLL